MALPVWPASLPELRGLYRNFGSSELHPAPQETQFDDGPNRTRRRTLFVTTPLNMALVMTAAQFVTFKAFHLNDLNAGTRRFTAPVILPDLTMGTRICRIPGKVSPTMDGAVQWLISFTLIVQDW